MRCQEKERPEETIRPNFLNKWKVHNEIVSPYPIKNDKMEKIHQGEIVMKTINIFHYISHARWIFLVWALFLMVQAFIRPSVYALANTGLAVFLMGLFLGFFGFSDIEKLSKKEKKEFANPKSIKISSIIFLVLAGYSFVMGIYFMNIKLIKPTIKENIAIELKTIGYHCLALGFGVLCFLKLIFDKYKYYKSLPEDKQ